MRTIYLQRSLSINGRSALGGRRLVDQLRGHSEDFLLGAMVNREEVAVGVDSALRPDVISEVQLLSFAPSVIVLEGGLLWGKGGAWRIDRRLAEEFVDGGGTLLVADVDLNMLREQRSEYGEIAGFLGASASFSGREPVAGYDEHRYWKGSKQILCSSDEMIVSDWLRPVYEGVPEVLCGLPVRLETWGDILASGNQNSTWSDATDGIPGPDSLPWASVHKRGGGFVVFISALVTADAWLEGCPHNTTWLLNICRFLSDAAVTDRQRAQAVVKSQESLFLSHATADKVIVSTVFELLTGEYAVGSWIDTRELLPGDSLPEHIERAIGRASAFVVFWSESAARSQWVQRELEVALAAPEPTVLLVRLDDADVPNRLSHLLRVEAVGLSSDEIARTVAATMQRRRMRVRIEEASKRGMEAIQERADHREETPDYPPDASLTRGSNHRMYQPSGDLRVTGAVLPSPSQLASVDSSYRVDILSFVDGGTLLVGSGTVSEEAIAGVCALGLVDAVERVSSQTGMDGHLADHRQSRRHLLYGYEYVEIVDRSAGEVVATIKCESNANVMSAAWSPGGDRVIVGSTNYLTIADDRGRHVRHENLFSFGTNYAPKSVAWQPSSNAFYVTGSTVVVADPEGGTLRTLAGLNSDMVAVAVSPDCRFVAGSTRIGEVAVWSEWGEVLTVFDGVASDGWHPSHCLDFSPDSRYLCQAPCYGGDGFVIFELDSGKTARIGAPGVNLLAFHPAMPDLLVTAADRRISFWQLGAGGEDVADHRREVSANGAA